MQVSPVKAPKAKKAPKGKRAVLADADTSANAAAAAEGGKTVEEMYVKMTQLQHILKRPDTYGEPSLFADRVVLGRTLL